MRHDTLGSHAVQKKLTIANGSQVKGPTNLIKNTASLRNWDRFQMAIGVEHLDSKKAG